MKLTQEGEWQMARHQPLAHLQPVEQIIFQVRLVRFDRDRGLMAAQSIFGLHEDEAFSYTENDDAQHYGKIIPTAVLGVHASAPVEFEQVEISPPRVR